MNETKFREAWCRYSDKAFAKVGEAMERAWPTFEASEVGAVYINCASAEDEKTLKSAATSIEASLKAELGEPVALIIDEVPGKTGTTCRQWLEERASKQEAQATKVCTRCGKEKPLSEYSKNVKTKDGYRHVCNDCVREALSKAWHTDDRDVKVTAEPAKAVVRVTESKPVSVEDAIEALRQAGYTGTLTMTKTIEL